MPLPSSYVPELFRLPRWALMLGLPIFLAALVVGAWMIDTAAHRDRVVRNVKVAGETVGGLTDVALRARVQAVADRVANTQIVIQTELGDATWVASDLGVSVNVLNTFESVMNTRREGLINRPLNWLSSLVSTTSSKIDVQVDLATLEQALYANDQFERSPVEPSARVALDQLQLVPGVPGKLIDVRDAAQSIKGVIEEGANPTIQVETVEVATRFSDDAVGELVAQANRAVQTPLQVRLNDYETAIAPQVMAGWFVLDLENSVPTLDLDHALILSSLEELLMPGNTGAGQAEFDIRNGLVRIISSDGGTACCDVTAVEIVVAALRAGHGDRTHVLPNRPAAPREAVERLEALGVVEKVASFTTEYACCVGRVTNIQKFAEIMSGKWIKPGGRLSLNETVGRRTEESGFVPGGFISKGHLVEDIGGGVSQYATTIFNASVRAGLDFDYYQAHSIYFDRYPYGLEATISYPKPDLVITNPTPFGVLIWNSWTDESITVDIYSTTNVRVTLEEPTETPLDQCTRVKTERLRVWQNGSEETDYFYATYRPEEGLNCDGTPSDPDQTTTTTIDLESQENGGTQDEAPSNGDTVTTTTTLDSE